MAKKAPTETEEIIEEIKEAVAETEAAKPAEATQEELDAVSTESNAETETAAGESTEEVTEEAESEEPKTTKAGKRSAKAVREAEAEEARQEAKEHRAETEAAKEEAPKRPKRQQPNPLHQHGKKYREAAKLIEVGRAYSLTEAVELAKKTASTKFDSTVELHVNLGVDPRQADQMVRATVVLPHGTGKTLRVAVYADGPAAEAAKEAGADLIGTDKLITAIEKGKTDFDMLISTPAGMAALGKVAKILGPRGLMPNPKSGTVTPDPAKAVKDAKGGKVEFRIDKQAIIHQSIGKASFSAENLLANATTLLSAILKAKPASAKGTYVKAVATTTSMGPGIKIDAPATISAIATGKK